MMEALVLAGYGEFEYFGMPKPVPGPNGVLTGTVAVSVCGGDVHGVDGSSGGRIPPLLMGHEAAGQIAALDEGVEGWTVGDRVTSTPTAVLRSPH